MIEKKSPTPPGTLVLIVRRTINADAERLFDAWTRSEELLAWWGPRPVRCTRADVDLRVGGRYRIDNLLPTGDLLTIEGEFTVVERPRDPRCLAAGARHGAIRPEGPWAHRGRRDARTDRKRRPP
jgi:hypothetical protein